MGRLADIFISLIVLIALLPILLLAALLIYITDPGPVFYIAKRAGLNGREFKMLKFRSMRIARESNASSRITSHNDNRIFPVGRILRLLKLDELPQFINILRGEMSIIGPRPEDITIVKQYYSNVLLESLQVKPGLASPGSIFNYTHLENDISSNDAEKVYLEDILPTKVKMDVVYARNKSLFYDISLILRTIKVIFLRTLGKKTFAYPPEYFEALKLDS